MKQFLLISFLAIFFAVSCDTDTAQYQKPPGAALANQKNLELEDAKMSPAWERLKGYSYREKEQALEEYGQAMEDLELKIESLEKRVESAGADIGHDIKESWKEDLENLRKRRDKLKGEFKKLSQATSENWSKLQASFESEWNDLQDRWEGVKAE